LGIKVRLGKRDWEESQAGRWEESETGEEARLGRKVRLGGKSDW
jgi:hypothetical protein